MALFKMLFIPALNWDDDWPLNAWNGDAVLLEELALEAWDGLDWIEEAWEEALVWLADVFDGDDEEDWAFSLENAATLEGFSNNRATDRS